MLDLGLDPSPSFFESWGADYLWRSLGWLVRADITLLGLMLVNAVVIGFSRVTLYRRARQQSRIFVRDAATALNSGRLSEVRALAARQGHSHVAAVIDAGLQALLAAPQEFSADQAVNTAQRASCRKSKALSAQFKIGLGSLATTATCAPFIGLVGTIFGILNAFGGFSDTRASLMALIAFAIAEALVTAGLGLFVAILAHWIHSYCRHRIEALESEMANATSELTSLLRRYRQSRNAPDRSPEETPGLLSVSVPARRHYAWEAAYDHQTLLLAWIWTGLLYLAYLFARNVV